MQDEAKLPFSQKLQVFQFLDFLGSSIKRSREVRRTVGRRSSQERFLMNRKSSLYPGVNGTGVGGPPLPGPTLRFQPQAFLRPPPQRDRPCGSSRKRSTDPPPYQDRPCGSSRKRSTDPPPQRDRPWGSSRKWFRHPPPFYPGPVYPGVQRTLAVH